MYIYIIPFIIYKLLTRRSVRLPNEGCSDVIKGVVGVVGGGRGGEGSSRIGSPVSLTTCIIYM